MPAEFDLSLLRSDPRPDLVKDSKLWERMIRRALLLPDTEKAWELSKRLWTIRSIGTIICRPNKVSRLEPIVAADDDSDKKGWPSQEFYEEMKVKYLTPYAAEIRALLREVTEIQEGSNGKPKT